MYKVGLTFTRETNVMSAFPLLIARCVSILRDVTIVISDSLLDPHGLMHLYDPE